jgi:heterodisulfide reductase subunit A
MYLDAVKSQVTDNCDGCALCLDVCPYQALRLEPVAGASTPMARKIVSDSALCKGCGACEATCPKAGITVLGFTHEQLRAQVQAVLACK